jgi:hypothetical protein
MKRKVLYLMHKITTVVYIFYSMTSLQGFFVVRHNVFHLDYDRPNISLGVALTFSLVALTYLERAQIMLK